MNKENQYYGSRHHYQSYGYNGDHNDNIQDNYNNRLRKSRCTDNNVNNDNDDRRKKHNYEGQHKSRDHDQNDDKSYLDCEHYSDDRSHKFSSDQKNKIDQRLYCHKDHHTNDSDNLPHTSYNRNQKKSTDHQKLHCKDDKENDSYNHSQTSRNHDSNYSQSDHSNQDDDRNSYYRGDQKKNTNQRKMCQRQ